MFKIIVVLQGTIYPSDIELAPYYLASKERELNALQLWVDRNLIISYPQGNMAISPKLPPFFGLKVYFQTYHLFDNNWYLTA